MTTRPDGTYSLMDLPEEVVDEVEVDGREPTLVTKVLQEFNEAVERSTATCEAVDEKAKQLRRLTKGPSGRRRSDRFLRAVGSSAPPAAATGD